MTNCADSAYLLRKKIQPHGIRRRGLAAVTVPIYDVVTQELMSLQFIFPDGTKRFLTNGRISGGYSPLGVEDKPDLICVAEGFATAATINEATGLPVAVAFTCGNLRAVVEGLRKKYRKTDFIICADNDHATDNNSGLTHATEIAHSLGAALAVPEFLDLNGKTDFNDLAIEQGLDVVREQILAAASNPLDAIPANFKLTKDRLLFLEEKTARDGSVQIVPHPVCSWLEVAALTRDDDGGEWGRLLRFKDLDGKIHEWAMPTEMLAGDGIEYRRRLWEQGLLIWPTKWARFGLHEYLGQCRPRARARAVTSIGYHGSVYVLPDEVFGEMHHSERTLFQSTTALAHAFNVRGTLEEWRREVAMPCLGNSRLILAVSAAFAAALLYLTGDESGGIHFVGSSSLGKTTVLRVAGSAWGGGSDSPAGYLRQWRATANGLEGIAALHNDTLLCLDEISEIAPREAGNVAYMAANGQGKARARRDGSARPAFSWRILFLSSGEGTLADKVREDARQRATAGQQVRVLDIPADAGAGHGIFEDLHGSANGQIFADRLKDATRAYYGTAARALLREIAKESGEVAEVVRAAQSDFVKDKCSADADGQVRRAASRFGLIAAAGELATACDITGWSAGAAMMAAKTCFNAWLNRRGHKGPAEEAEGVEQVIRFFAMHGDSRFSNGYHDHPVINRAGFKKDGFYWVFPEIFRKRDRRGLRCDHASRRVGRARDARTRFRWKTPTPVSNSG